MLFFAGYFTISSDVVGSEQEEVDQKKHLAPQRSFDIVAALKNLRIMIPNESEQKIVGTPTPPAPRSNERKQSRFDFLAAKQGIKRKFDESPEHRKKQKPDDDKPWPQLGKQ